jgi:hypothetical protein
MRTRISFLYAAILCGAAHAQFTGTLADFNVNLGGHSFNGPVPGSSFGDLQPGGGGAGATGAGAASGLTGLVSWTIWDGYGPHGNDSVGSKGDLRDFGGQKFDVKALYMTNDLDYLYIGVVTCFDPAGTPDPYGRSRVYRVGDLAINPNWAANSAEFGILLPTADAGSSGSAGIVAGGEWHTPDRDVGFGAPALSNYKSGGVPTGASADYIYAALEYGGSAVVYSDPVTGSNVPLHLLEVRVALDDLDLDVADMVAASWSVSCNNDFLDGAHTLVVPEPATLAGLACALVGIVALRRKAS